LKKKPARHDLDPPALPLPPNPANSRISASGALPDWWHHLLQSPAKQAELAALALAPWSPATGNPPTVPDKRFAAPEWQAPPWRWLAQSFLHQEQWWFHATTGVPGVAPRHEALVSFAAKQWLNMMAPSNFWLTNPVVQQQTLREGGANLVRGAALAVEDACRSALNLPPAGAENFQPGRDVAITPGQVVLRNDLIELIQYTPTTGTVHAEPILMVPAWIMKYYVLDLTPSRSMVKHLVDQGFTVFAISWKNPDATDRDLGMADYLDLGVRAALHAIRRIVPKARIHGVGYCLGGTLLAMAAAALARDRDDSLQTLTLLAAQTDFSEPGELSLFIDPEQVARLETLMSQRGYLDKQQMSAAFQMLRSNELIWWYRLHTQLLGERLPLNDLMAWNADGTRLPLRMHSEYLRGLFLHNELARGTWRVDGTPINLRDVAVPVFNVGTRQDHVAPWRSVFKLHSLTDAEQTFVLTTGGHNVGIVNPPGTNVSSHQLKVWHPGDPRPDPEDWLQSAPTSPGSWWTPWDQWLARHSSRKRPPPAMGAPEAGLPPLSAAPGHFVFTR
jgi:polyhydroxyalkanoate synthase